VRIFQANGAFTSERGYFWENHFNISSLIFVGILILLVWGIFAWYQERKKENLKNNPNVKNNIISEQSGSNYSYNRELAQAKLREQEMSDDDGMDGIPTLQEQIINEQNKTDNKNS